MNRWVMIAGIIDGKFTSNKNEKVENHPLTKSCYVTGTRCSKALFLQKKSPELIKIESLQDRKIKREGAEVGAYARLQFPDGVLIDTLDIDQALNNTRQAIEQWSSCTI